MVDVFLVMILLAAGLALGEGDPATTAAERHSSDTPITDDAPREHFAATPCATPAPHWRDLSTLNHKANSGVAQEEGADDAQ